MRASVSLLALMRNHTFSTAEFENESTGNDELLLQRPTVNRRQDTS